MSEAVAAQLKETIQADEAEEAAANGAEETSEGTPAAGNNSGLPAQTDDAMIRAKMLALLEELGLVERTEAGAMKTAQAGTLQKADIESDLSKRDTDLQNAITSGDKALAGDIAKVYTEVQSLSKRLAATAGLGPVIREINQDPRQVAALQKVDSLRDVLNETTDPVERERLQLEITRLDIYATQPKR